MFTHTLLHGTPHEGMLNVKTLFCSWLKVKRNKFTLPQYVEIIVCNGEWFISQ